MALPVEEHQIGFLDLKAGVGLALPCQVRTAWIQAGGSDLGHGTGAAGEAWSHFAGGSLHCSLREKNKIGLRNNTVKILLLMFSVRMRLCDINELVCVFTKRR